MGTDLTNDSTIENIECWLQSQNGKCSTYDRYMAQRYARQLLATMQREAKLKMENRILWKAIEIADNRLSQEPLTDVDIDVAVARLRLALTDSDENANEAPND